MLLPWLIAVPVAIGALFYFLWKMVQSCAVKWFGVDCSLDMSESWPFLKMTVLSVLLNLVLILGIVCLAFGERYCGNAELIELTILIFARVSITMIRQALCKHLGGSL